MDSTLPEGEKITSCRIYPDSWEFLGKPGHIWNAPQRYRPSRKRGRSYAVASSYDGGEQQPGKYVRHTVKMESYRSERDCFPARKTIKIHKNVLSVKEKSHGQGLTFKNNSVKLKKIENLIP